MGGFVGALATSLFLLISIGLLLSAVKNLQQANDSMAWPGTTAQIIGCSEVRSRRYGGRGSDSYDTYYYVDYDYTYAVDGVEYRSKESSYSRTHTEAEAVRLQYQAGPNITVYYNRSDPSQSSLKRGATFVHYFSIAVSAMMVIALIIVLLNLAWPS